MVSSQILPYVADQPLKTGGEYQFAIYAYDVFLLLRASLQTIS